MKIRTLLIVAAAAVMLPSLASAQQDQVFGRNGTPTRGTIRAIGKDEIKIDASGITRTFQVNEVLKVTYGDEPSELRAARESVIAGQYEDALDSLGQIDASADLIKPVLQDIEYYKAYCACMLALRQGGDKAAATTQLLKFLSGNSTSYHFYEAAELVGDMAIAIGRYDNAATYYRQVGTAPWPEYKMRAAVLEANALSIGGKYAEALTKYQQVASAGLNTPPAMEQKLQATVGTAVCLAATGKHEQGIKIVEDLIAKNDPNDMQLFGRAYNALGQCYYKAGKPKDALLAFLHTDLLFFGDPEIHAEALYYLSKLWGDVNKSDRAVRARSTLSTRYAGSRWASMD